MLFVYALHFFLLTQAALAPPARASCAVHAVAGSPRDTGVARGIGAWSGKAAGEGARTGLGTAIPRSLRSGCCSARGWAGGG